MIRRTNQYRLDWVKIEDRPEFISFLTKHNRQTMNARLMNSAHLVVAKHRNEIIGCGGIDIQYFKDFPEMFSLFVLPEYRREGVGMSIELARYMLADQNGIKQIYIRIEQSAANSLLEHRTKSKSFSFVEPGNENYTGMCRFCEYYQNRCAEQRFMLINVEQRMQHIITKLGKIGKLPAKIDFKSR